METPAPSPQAVAFADLAGYTALTEAHGDADAVALVARFFALVGARAGAGTRLVKTLGDAALLTSPTAAALLHAVTSLRGEVAEERDFPLLSVGMDAGPIVVRDGDVFGSTVNRAARLTALAAPGELLASRAFVDGLPRGSQGAFVGIGEPVLRNIAEPVAVFRLEAAPTGPVVVDPVCRMRVRVGAAAATRRRNGTEHHFCSRACAALFDDRIDQDGTDVPVAKDQR